MASTVSSWQEIVYHARSVPPGLSALRQLRDNESPAIVMKDMLDPHILSAFQKAVETYRDRAIVSRYPNGTLTTIGPYLAKHLKNTAPYFVDARATDTLFPDPTLDLRAYVREKIKQTLGLKTFELACEEDGRVYAPAIIRLHSHGINNPLHNDHIMRDAAGTDLILARLHSQFSCIVCVQECDEGGELVLYRKPWEATDEVYKIPNGLGYDYGVVAAREYYKYKPAAGDVYIINPTNYHEIYEVRGKERRTLGFFFGFFDAAMEHGVVWS